MGDVIVPPIKSQGIKTKLVPWIKSTLPDRTPRRWIEPFMGTGVVGFNIEAGATLMSDTNPHLVRFYRSVADGVITSELVRIYLEGEGEQLYRLGERHYYAVRDRFNESHSPLDFLFLSRAGFNGMIRFNRRGEYNIPFCRKPERFSRSYVTKIVNQVGRVQEVLAAREFELLVQDFESTIELANEGDVIYCDPPYLGRHADFYNGWTMDDEQRLHDALRASPAEFVVSTWARNRHRENPALGEIWSDFAIVEREHYYHVGGRLENRGSVTEALVCSLGLLQRAERAAAN